MGTKTLQAYKSKGTKTKLKKNISTYIYTTIPRSLTEVLKPYPHKSRVLKKNKAASKNSYKQDNSPFQYAHFSLLCCSPPYCMLSISSFLSRIAKDFLLAFAE